MVVVVGGDEVDPIELMFEKGEQLFCLASARGQTLCVALINLAKDI